MRSLPLPEQDEIADLDIAVGRARARYIGSLSDDDVALVREDYSNYESAAFANALLNSFAAAEEDALRWSYTLIQQDRLLSHVRELLMKNVAIKRCPMCGVGRPRTLDHYLPRQEYPQFSILPRNLVPCCEYCNNKKGKRVGVYDARYFHPYYDVLPEERVLNATVEILDDTVVVEYWIEKTPSITDSLYETVAWHFHELELGDLFLGQGLDRLANLVGACGDWAEDGADNVAAQLEALARSNRLRMGTNHWETVILQSASESLEYCSGGFRMLQYSGS